MNAVKIAEKNKKMMISIEELKIELNENLYKFQKMHDKQFETKVELWNALAVLEYDAQDLWLKNTRYYSNNLKKNLKNANINLRKSQIFLSKELFQQIEDILSSLHPFVLNKEQLRDSQMNSSNNMNMRREELIRENEEKLSTYSNMLNELKINIMQEEQTF